MRIDKYEAEMIKKAFMEIFEEGSVYLFGSRVDDTAREGDIDLYLVPSKRLPDIKARKIKFLVKLDEYIGEQKIDVVIACDSGRMIEREAKEGGVLL